MIGQVSQNSNLSRQAQKIFVIHAKHQMFALSLYALSFEFFFYCFYVGKVYVNKWNVCVCVCVCVCEPLRHVQLFATPWTVAHQAPLSMGFPSQEYWSGLPLPPPGDLPHPGVKPRSPTLASLFCTTEPPGTIPTYPSRGTQFNLAQ